MDFSALNIFITACIMEVAYFNSHFLTLVAESRQPLLKRTDSKYSTVMRFLTTNNADNLSGLFSQMDFSALNILIAVCSIAVAYF